jgi:hypothetical protein
MPLTKKGREIMDSMQASYKDKGGAKKAKEVFYASANSGKIKGVEKKQKK